MAISPNDSQRRVHLDSFSANSEDSTSIYFLNADTYVEETQTEVEDSTQTSKDPPDDKVSISFEHSNPQSSHKGFRSTLSALDCPQSTPISQCPTLGPPGWRWQMDHRIFYSAYGAAEAANLNDSGGDSIEQTWEHDAVNSPTSFVQRVMVNDDGLNFSKVNPKFLNTLMASCGDTPPSKLRNTNWERFPRID